MPRRPQGSSSPRTAATPALAKRRPDETLIRALGANGRRAVEDTFHWDNVAVFTEDVYHATLH